MAGLIMRNASNVITLNMTSRVSKSIGSISTGTANGSAIVSFPAGTPWWVRVTTATTGVSGKPPAVTLSGSTFTWSFSYQSGLGEYPVAATIHYGVR